MQRRARTLLVSVMYALTTTYLPVSAAVPNAENVPNKSLQLAPTARQVEQTNTKSVTQPKVTNTQNVVKPVQSTPVESKKNLLPSRSSGERKIRMKITEYNQNDGETPGTKTANGEHVHVGGCAVDPRYYKFGTRFILPDGTELTANDTGSDIKGPTHIDRYVSSVKEMKTEYADVIVIPN